MVDVGDLVSQAHNLSFQGRRNAVSRVVFHPLPDFPGKIQPISVLLQKLHNPDALQIMAESFGI